MKSKMISIFILGAILLFSALVYNHNKTPLPLNDEQTALEYVNSLGYKIIKHEGEPSRYILKKELVTELPYMASWIVQTVEPEDYFDREIVTYGYIVEEHPLEKKFAVIYKERGFKTFVGIMLVNGSVIGGVSAPVSMNNDHLLGGYLYIDGRDLEELKGVSYPEWSEIWFEKYGK